MKLYSITVLRLIILFVGLLVLALCIFALPAGLRDANATDYYPIIWSMYASVVPFYLALYQAYILLKAVDKRQAFAPASLSALRRIQYYGLAISALYAASSPYVYRVADQEDAPGILALALVVIFAAFVIAAFAAVLHSLLQSAIALKSENDLTV